MKTQPLCLLDAELIRLLKNDDRAAFSTIYEKYWEKLYLSAYVILKNNDSAEDIVQEVMISLWLRRHKVEVENLKAYLHQSVRFQVFKLLRKEKKMPLSPISDAHVETVNAAESDFQLEDINKALLQGVERLPDRCREIFLLRRVKELSIKEISEKLQLSPKTVENQLTIALRKIRLSISKSSEELLPIVAFIYFY